MSTIIRTFGAWHFSVSSVHRSKREYSVVISVLKTWLFITYYNILTFLRRASGQLGKLYGGKPDVGVAGGPVPARFRRRPQPEVRHGGIWPSRTVAGRQRDGRPTGVHRRQFTVWLGIRHQRLRVQQSRPVRSRSATRLHPQVGRETHGYVIDADIILNNEY